MMHSYVTKQINGMDGLDYAKRLKKIKKPMYSIQVRNERFKKSRDEISVKISHIFQVCIKF